MARKFLFLMGIVAAHGALAVGLTSESQVPRQVVRTDTCEGSADAPLHYAPPRELLAFVVAPDPSGAGVGHP
jgi:hypothetical protein